MDRDLISRRNTLLPIVMGRDGRFFKHTTGFYVNLRDVVILSQGFDTILWKTNFVFSLKTWQP